MKIAEINMATGILSGMKLNKIADKKVKATLVNDYLNLRKFVKDADSDRNELISKFQDDWSDELSAIEAFRKEGKPVVGHDSYLEAEADANRAISDIFSREVEVSIKPVPMDDFMVACGDEELTLEQLAFLQETGVIE